MTVTPHSKIVPHPHTEDDDNGIEISKGKDREEDALDEQNEMTEMEEKLSRQSLNNFLGSIKFWFIAIMSIIIITSVLVISIIFISSFVPSILDFSDKVKDSEFMEIVNFITYTMKEIQVMSETMKNQLLLDLDFSNRDQIEVVMFRFLKLMWKYHKGLVVTVHIGDNQGRQYGFMDWLGTALLFNITTSDQYMYYCPGWETSSVCLRNKTADFMLGYFDLTNMIVTGDAHPSSPSIVLSFIDATQPQFTFLTMMNAVPQFDQGHPFKYYLGIDMSSETISKKLASATKLLSGSTSMVIEVATNYVIANGNPDARVAQVLSDGSVERQTYTQINNDPRASQITAYLYTQFGDNLKQLKCNTNYYYSTSSDYISVRRLCTDTHIDWAVILAVPQWNYVSSIIISVILSIIGAAIVLTVGICLSVFVSVRMVKPFYNLIAVFQQVSNMELENLIIYKSRFSEVKNLQAHFLFLVEKLKLYRAFLPSYLLMELDNGKTQNNKLAQEHDKHESSLFGTHNTSSKYGSSRNNSSLQQGIRKSMFALYLEKKQVSVLCLCLQGLDDLLYQLNSNECVELLKDVFEHLNVTSRTLGGFVGNFENDMITIAFNASSEQSNHQEKVTLASHQLYSKLMITRNKKWEQANFALKKPELLNAVHFRIGICTQETICGNIGTKESKNFTIISSLKFNLEAMIQVCKKLDVSIVMTDRIFPHLEDKYLMRYIYTLDMIPDQTLTNLHSNMDLFDGHNVRTLSANHIYELGASLQVEMDEWLYELDQKKKKTKWNSYNAACKIFFNGQYEQAKYEFDNYYAIYSDDKPTEYMIQRCEQMLRK